MSSAMQQPQLYLQRESEPETAEKVNSKYRDHAEISMLEKESSVSFHFLCAAVGRPSMFQEPTSTGNKRPRCSQTVERLEVKRATSTPKTLTAHWL